MSTSKTVLVTPQIPIAYHNGGIGTFIAHFTRLLVSAGETVQIIFTEPPQKPESEWKPYFDDLAVEVVSLYERSFRVPQNMPHFLKIAEMADEAISLDTDVIYFADWRANGIQSARIKRFRPERSAALVTVLHGCSEWHRQGQNYWPSSYEEMLLDYAERYVAQHSDFVVAPTHYALNWARANSWKLPEQERTRALGYPFFPRDFSALDSDDPSTHFRRIAFFGRMETRKGFDLFIKALLKLAEADIPALRAIDEVLFIGGRSQHIYGTPETAAQILKDNLSASVLIKDQWNTEDALDYLAAHADDTLVVIPSRAETMGFTVIEASLVPGLNVIASNVGGIPEIFDTDVSDHLFEPTVTALADKLNQWLQQGPRQADRIAQYDWQAANQRWLDFHEEVKDYVLRYRKTRSISRPQPLHTPRKPVEICMAYYNHGKYLPQALQSLAEQTFQDFQVIVVNDGSTDEHSIEVFQEMRTLYEPRGWKFVSTANQGVCAARNYAVTLGKAEYICFMDADNVAAPDMIDTFYHSILNSQDDCLTCYLYAFMGNRNPIYGRSPRLRITVPPLYLYYPIGNYPAAGLFENVYGDTNCILKRTAFEAVGGFHVEECRRTANEDVQLFSRLSLNGYTIDVIPEFLFFYRHIDDSRMRQADTYVNETRLVAVYEEHLRKVGLEDLAPLILGLKYKCRELQNRPAWQPPADNETAIVPAAPDFDVDYLVYQVRWYTLLTALRRKIMNWPAKVRRRLFSGRSPYYE